MLRSRNVTRRVCNILAIERFWNKLIRVDSANSTFLVTKISVILHPASSYQYKAQTLLVFVVFYGTLAQ